MISIKAINCSRVGAIVLAAGGSTRMGEVKQLLPLGDSAVLGQTLHNVRDAGVDEIVLVLGFSAESIRMQIPVSDMAGVKVVVNTAYRLGMASSLREGLTSLSSDIDAALIVLADQPFVRPETLARIIEKYRLSIAQIVIPFYRGFRGNPVLLERSVFSEVMSLEGDVGCRAIFDKHLDGIVRVEVDDVGVLLDLDNKEDYARMQHFGEPKRETSEEAALNIIAEIISQRRETPRE